MRIARKVIATAALSLTLGLAAPAVTSHAAAKSTTYDCTRLAKNVAAGTLKGKIDGYIACNLI